MALDVRYSLDQTLRLLSIPSPTGYPRQVCDALVETLEGLDFSRRACSAKAAWCARLAEKGVPLSWPRMWTRWG